MDAAPRHSADSIRTAAAKLAEMDQLHDIAEGSEDEEDDEPNVPTPSLGQQRIEFTPFEVAQAFSHFAYRATWRKRLVCDLQGAFDQQSNVLRLSDPVIHYYNNLETHRRNVHGNTDRGRKGAALFFDRTTNSADISADSF
jgi:Alpha-kinase family